MKNNTLHQMVDILPPTAPINSPSFFYISIFFIFLVIIFLYLYRDKINFKKRFWLINYRYKKQHINNRQCAVQLAKLLISYCSKNNINDPSKNMALYKYQNTLELACYSRNGLSNNLTQQLLKDIKQCL
jgi:hypothetical protein